MMDLLDDLDSTVTLFGTAPTFEEMPRRSLTDKGIAGPTAAHVIEEVHVPLNLACVTFTTGSTAFQNIVGITHEEMPERIRAAHKALELAGVPRGARAVVAYAPLVNVFTAQALREYDLHWTFLRRSSRDALILALCREQPSVIIGESSFLRAGLNDAAALGFAEQLPRNCVVLCAGTPLDLELLPLAERYGWQVHDLYGCQEFGWIALDGVPVRSDVSLAPSPLGGQYHELVVGGMPLADSFPVSESGHVCNSAGKLITYRRGRTEPEYEVWVAATPLSNTTTLSRAARTMLRIKGRVVKLRPDIVCNAPATVLELVPGICARGEVPEVALRLDTPEQTLLFDTLVQAQKDLQETGKTDPAWMKSR